AAEGRTMVIVTQEIEFARKAADKIIFMDDGLIVDQGTPEEVLDNSLNERTRAFLDQNNKF
ncbi:MAG: glutamine ABC transporter ATP-binding protein GlnQ, partial [Clostridiales bacterium]|nr:glutamine ABC transporter ATP-binding protein GlnQ [Clostridiales bacterium]